MQSCVLLNRPFFAVLVVVAVQHYTIVLFFGWRGASLLALAIYNIIHFADSNLGRL